MSTILTPSAKTPSASAPVELGVWFTRCPVPTPFGLALQLGWLDREFSDDTDVSFRALQTSKDPKVHQAHYTHTQKNLFRHGGNYPAIWAQSSGANTKVIGLSWVYGSQSIVALPGSGIKTAADLKGKRLLVVRRPKEDIDFVYATALRTYEIALAEVGLKLSDVQLVEHVVDRSFISDRVQPGSPDYVTFRQGRKGGTGGIRGTEALWPLINGEADVIVGSARQVELLGLQVIYEGVGHPAAAYANNSAPLTFAVNAELIEEHPEIVARVYARALQAIEWAKHNHSDAVRFVAREQGQSENQVEEHFGDKFDATLETDLDPKKIEGLRAVKDFLLRNRIIKNDFSVDAWIDPRPLQAARKLLEERRKSAEYKDEVAGTVSRRPSGIRASTSCGLS